MKDGKAEGAFNIRKDSGCAGRVNTENVTITTKTDKPGIDIRFVPGCKDSCHIPVIITESGLRETVYNDFLTSARARTSRSCRLRHHNCGLGRLRARRRAYVLRRSKNARVKYVEKHYGEGDGNGKKRYEPHDDRLS